MPFKSKAQRQWGHSQAGMKALGGAAKVAEWDRSTKGRLPERVSLKVNNKMRGTLGITHWDPNSKVKKAVKVEINVKAHKGNKAELASTVKHELMHVNHPKMTEKEVYKRTAKTKISPSEQRQLLKKLGVSPGQDLKPGDLITRANNQKENKNKLSIMGMV